LLIDSLLTPIMETTYLNMDMCKFESLQKDEGTVDWFLETMQKH